MYQSRLWISLLLIILVISLGWGLLLNEAKGDSLSEKTREANQLYRQGKYDEALSKYADAQLESPESKQLYFNIGDTHYRKAKYEEAISSYQKALATTDIVLEAKANYNIGAALYRQGNLQLSLVYYRAVKDLLGMKAAKGGRNVWEDAKYNGGFGEAGRAVWENAKFNCEFVQRKILEIMSKRMPDYLAVTPPNPVVIVGEKIKLNAAGYRFGKNKKKDGVKDDGKPKGDDIGPISIEAHWTTDAPESIGAIDEKSGVFTAGDAVGEARASAQDRTEGHFPRSASAPIRVIMPDRLEISSASAVIAVGSTAHFTAQAYSNGPNGVPDPPGNKSAPKKADSKKGEAKSDEPTSVAAISRAPTAKGDDIGPLSIAVEWAIKSGQDLGVIDPKEGTFTAGAKEGKVVISARPVRPSCKAVSAAVEVTIVRPNYLRVAPADAPVPSGGKQQFYARAYSKGPDGKMDDVDPTGKPLGDDQGPFDVEVTWSVDAPQDVGGIDAKSGLFTAGKAQGEAEIIASSSAKDIELEDAKAVVHVVSLDYIRVVPPQAKLGLNDRKQFTAQGFNNGPDGKPNEVDKKGQPKGDDLGPFPINVEWSADLPGDVGVIGKKTGLLRSLSRPGKGKVSAVTVGAGATLGASAQVEIEDKNKKKQNQKKKQNRPQPKPQPKQQKRQKKKMSKKEAEQLLQALLADEKNQRKLRRTRRSRRPEIEKDW